MRYEWKRKQHKYINWSVFLIISRPYSHSYVDMCNMCNTFQLKRIYYLRNKSRLWRGMILQNKTNYLFGEKGHVHLRYFTANIVKERTNCQITYLSNHMGFAWNAIAYLYNGFAHRTIMCLQMNSRNKLLLLHGAWEGTKGGEGNTCIFA